VGAVPPFGEIAVVAPHLEIRVVVVPDLAPVAVKDRMAIALFQRCDPADMRAAVVDASSFLVGTGITMTAAGEGGRAR
jgi:hypothetical protein